MSSPVDMAGIVVAGARGPRAQAIDTVRDFMDAMERGDLAAASARCALRFTLLAPGGVRCQTLAELVAFGRGRYLEIHKAERELDACESAAGIVVYAHGVMNGRWLDGSSFAGLRYVDRFLIVEGQVLELQILNELGEHRPR